MLTNICTSCLDLLQLWTEHRAHQGMPHNLCLSKVAFSLGHYVSSLIRWELDSSIDYTFTNHVQEAKLPLTIRSNIIFMENLTSWDNVDQVPALASHVRMEQLLRVPNCFQEHGTPSSCSHQQPRGIMSGRSYFVLTPHHLISIVFHMAGSVTE